MADIIQKSSIPADNFYNNTNTSDVENCTKCIDIEIQLQQALEELSSAQLIIQMLKKEATHEETTIISNQVNEHQLYTADHWEIKRQSKTKKEDLKVN